MTAATWSDAECFITRGVSDSPVSLHARTLLELHCGVVMCTGGFLMCHG